jgi:hypothetical protein
MFRRIAPLAAPCPPQLQFRHAVLSSVDDSLKIRYIDRVDQGGRQGNREEREFVEAVR